MDENNADNLIEILTLYFFKGLYYNLKPEDVKQMNWENQGKFLNQTVKTKLFKKYPCNRNFSVRFFKNLIKYLETEQEVHDDMYEFLCVVMNENENEYSYHHYVIKNDLNNIITIKETKNMVVNGTTGLKTWEAALMLSDWAVCNKEVFTNRNVLELGSGVGFTGLTIAKHCNIKSMIMTDCHFEVLKTVNDNVSINLPEYQSKEVNYSTLYTNGDKTIGVMMLDWNDTDNLVLQSKPDIVIGADIVYDPSILQSLLNVLILMNKINKNVDIYIASVIRNQDTYSEFLKVLESSNFEYEHIQLKNNGYVDWDDSVKRCFIKINKK